MASASGIRAARAYVEFFADATKLDAGLRTISDRLKNVGSEMRGVALKIGAAFAPIAGVVAASVKTFTGFDDVMRTVGAVSQSSSQQIAMLRDKAAELGRDTSFTASQVGEAMLNLARAGFSPEEITNMIGPMLNLSRASGTDLAQAADIAAVALRSFSLNATEAERAADVLVATANNSAQTVGDLGEALKYVAPVAADAGMNLEDTALTLGTMANYGIRGSMAGTAMRQALLRLANPDIQKQLREVFGVVVTDGEGNMRKLHEILKDLDKSLEGVASSDRVAVMQELFDLRGMSVGLKVGQADLKQLDDAIRNAAGTAERTAVEMDEGLGGGFRRLASAAESAALALADALEPALKPIIEWITQAATSLQQFIKEHQDWAVTIASVVAGVTVLTAIVYAMGTAISVAAGIITAFRVAITAVQVAITVFKTAVAVTTTVITTLRVAMTTATTVIPMLKAALASLSLSNPFTAAIAGVGLLIGGVVSLVGWLRRGKKEMDDTKKAGDELVAAQAEAQRQQAEAERKAEEERRKAEAEEKARQEEERRRLKTQQALEFEKSMEERLQETRISMIEDRTQREIASINQRYQKEMEKAKELGASEAKVRAAWEAEVEAVKAKAAKERAEEEKRERERLEEDRRRFTEDIDQQLAEARIDATLEGTEKELAKLNLEKQRALAEAAELGVAPDKIEELYKLKEEAIRKSETPDVTAATRFSSGFSGFAVLAQGAGPAMETAKNTAKMTKQLAELNGLLNKNLQFN
ncbi:MAG TPA: phage tail tape measure protein [Bacillota bacterium]|nr:phage tail tape measure protein [Bacillota bacterium]